MARPREFDTAEALDAAMLCFWRHGYEAASVRDLSAEMGLTGASLYNAFGSKRALFRRVLDHYVKNHTAFHLGRLSALPPKQAIQTAFRRLVDISLEDPDRRGCLLVNSALDVAPHDPEIAADIARRFGEIEAFYRRTVMTGQADGSLPPGLDAADMARLLLALTVGIRVMARTKPDRALLEGMARPVLAMLGCEGEPASMAA